VLVDDYESRSHYWVLETVADLVERPGRAAIFAPAPVPEVDLRRIAPAYLVDRRLPVA
jgi:hypothetical protein